MPSSAIAFLAGLFIYGAAAGLGIAILAALFRTGLFGGVDILFYRGVVLSVLAAILAALVGWYLLNRIDRAPIREIIALAAFVFGINITFLVLGPVTVDRSISVFVLGVMDKEPDRAWTVRDLEERFHSLYVSDYKQIARRMDEQTSTGNVSPRGDGFVITPRGRGFVSSAKTIAWIFGTDTKIVDPGSDGKSR